MNGYIPVGGYVPVQIQPVNREALPVPCPSTWFYERSTGQAWIKNIFTMLSLLSAGGATYARFYYRAPYAKVRAVVHGAFFATAALVVCRLFLQVLKPSFNDPAVRLQIRQKWYDAFLSEEGDDLYSKLRQQDLHGECLTDDEVRGLIETYLSTHPNFTYDECLDRYGELVLPKLDVQCLTLVGQCLVKKVQIEKPGLLNFRRILGVRYFQALEKVVLQQEYNTFLTMPQGAYKWLSERNGEEGIKALSEGNNALREKLKQALFQQVQEQNVGLVDFKKMIGSSYFRDLEDFILDREYQFLIKSLNPQIAYLELRVNNGSEGVKRIFERGNLEVRAHLQKAYQLLDLDGLVEYREDRHILWDKKECDAQFKSLIALKTKDISLTRLMSTYAVLFTEKFLDALKAGEEGEASYQAKFNHELIAFGSLEALFKRGMDLNLLAEFLKFAPRTHFNLLLVKYVFDHLEKFLEEKTVSQEWSFVTTKGFIPGPLSIFITQVTSEYQALKAEIRQQKEACTHQMQPHLEKARSAKTQATALAHDQFKKTAPDLEPLKQAVQTAIANIKTYSAQGSPDIQKQQQEIAALEKEIEALKAVLRAKANVAQWQEEVNQENTLQEQLKQLEAKEVSYAESSATAESLEILRERLKKISVYKLGIPLETVKISKSPHRNKEMAVLLQEVKALEAQLKEKEEANQKLEFISLKTTLPLNLMTASEAAMCKYAEAEQVFKAAEKKRDEAIAKAEQAFKIEERQIQKEQRQKLKEIDDSLPIKKAQLLKRLKTEKQKVEADVRAATPSAPEREEKKDWSLD